MTMSLMTTDAIVLTVRNRLVRVRPVTCVCWGCGSSVCRGYGFYVRGLQLVHRVRGRITSGQQRGCCALYMGVVCAS